jgi:hypothetical protein
MGELFRWNARQIAIEQAVEIADHAFDVL